MIYDCAIVGGGPAGLNAALVLGRARRSVLVFDDNRPRNAVTHESHGFLTRDGVKPAEFRAYAWQDIAKYPSVAKSDERVVDAGRIGRLFLIRTASGGLFEARTLLLATGLSERLPEVAGIRDYYGKSLFGCPYCDGWEMRERPLVVIAESAAAYHLAKTVYQWSQDLVVATNGMQPLDAEQRERLQRRGVRMMEGRIAKLEGRDGMLEGIRFEDGTYVEREGGFVSAGLSQSSALAVRLGCTTHDSGGVAVDAFGRTNVRGVYAAGDTASFAPSQLIIAAGAGSRTAIGINTDLTEEDF